MKIFDSFWNPSFYKHNEKGLSFWRGLLRIVLINFIISIVCAIMFHVYIGKNIPMYFETFSNQVKDGYPANLILSIKDGILVKNITGELKLYPISGSLKNEVFTKADAPKYLIVIDETKEVSLSSFNASESFVFFGKDGFIAKGEDKVRMNSYKSIQGNEEKLSFSSSTIDFMINGTRKYVGDISTLAMVLIILLYTIFVTTGYLFFVIYLGLVVMLLSGHVFKQKLDYPKSYIYSLFALPTVLIVENILELIPYISNVVSYIPFFTTILTMVFLWYMLKEKKEGVIATN